MGTKCYRRQAWSRFARQLLLSCSSIPSAVRPALLWVNKDGLITQGEIKCHLKVLRKV